VAFATSDAATVDADFLTTRRLEYYDVSATQAQVLGHTFFEGAEGAASAAGDGLAARLAALSGCAVLFVTKAITGEAAYAMVKKHIFAVKLQRPTTIAEVIGQMQSFMGGNPPLWLRRALGGEAPTGEPVEAA
jgi:nitrogen fixation protein NifX